MGIIGTLVAALEIILAIAIIFLVSAITVIFLKHFSSRHNIKVKEGMNVSLTSSGISEQQYTQIMHYRNIAREKWEKILDRIKDDDERDLGMAIIKADSLLDEILMRHGCKGGDMGERLKNLNPADFKDLNDIWEAHKIRNRLSHEPDFHLQPKESRRVISIYHNAIEEILSKEIEMV